MIHQKPKKSEAQLNLVKILLFNVLEVKKIEINDKARNDEKKRQAKDQ
jgi:hypothetical protein